MIRNLAHLLRRFTGSLRFKLSFYAGLVVFLTVTALTYHSISTQEEQLINARVRSATKDSEVIKAAIWNGMMTKDRDVIRQIVAAIGKQEGFKAINIYDRNGVLHYTSRPDAANVIGLRPRNAGNGKLLENIGENTSVRYQFTDSDQILTVVNPLINTRSCSTAECHAHPESHLVLGALEVKLPMEGLRHEIRDNARKTIMYAFFLFILVSTITGVGVIFLASHPLRRLKIRAKKMARGEYVPEKPPTGADSISELARTFEEMSRQITQRTRQLDQSRKMYKELFEKVPCYLTVVNRDYRIVRANQAFQDEFGDHVGSHCFTGYKGLAAKCDNCLVEKTFADGAPHRGEEIWSLGKNRKAFVVVNTAPIFDEEGAVNEVLEMSLDVTRLENLQIELKRKEEQFQNLFENVPCYLTVVDSSFRIAFYNKMFARDFGDSWGRRCFKVYKGLESKCDACPVEKTFNDGVSHFSEEIWHRDGKDLHVILHTAPITDQNGQIVAVMEMGTNITELKLLQNELSILGETIAGMSHSVKNILSGLEGGVYVVESGLRTGKEDRTRTGWDMVKKNVDKVSELVKDILYASKERQPECRLCDPAQVLSEVYDLYWEKAQAKGIELVKDFDASMGEAFLDPNGIHSAVCNLVSNAVSACASNASVAEPKIILSGRIRGDRLLIQVTDNGCGMPDEVKQNLFKKFYSTKGVKGTGLGLVVTRKIIEEHGGSIQVASRLGEGTSFSVEVPLKPAEMPKTMRQTG